MTAGPSITEQNSTNGWNSISHALRRGPGPWQHGLPEAERVARLRELRALCAAFAGGTRTPLVAALAHAETDAGGLAAAARLFDALPTRWRRNVLATLGALARSARAEGPPDAA